MVDEKIENKRLGNLHDPGEKGVSGERGLSYLRT
jgi:hypothetical protein